MMLEGVPNLQSIPNLFYGVVKVTTLEPFDNEIVAELGDKRNFYHKIVLVMKYSTQEYYNMRIALGLEIN